MLKDFKAFILRGNVVDLAIGVVIGAAFTALVESFVDNLLNPLIGIPGEADFSDRTFAIGENEFLYGAFLNSVITFLLVAVAVFFFVVKPVNALMARRKTKPDVESTTKDCGHCLSSIPGGATVCAFCTRDVAA